MTKQAPQLDIEQILDNVRKEAAELELVQSDQAAVPVDLSQAVSLPEPKLSSLNRFVIKSEYQLHELLRFDDMQFVANAFRGILQREPDDAGLDGYTAYLRNGGSKEHLLADLLMSEEGQQRGVKINGLEWPIARHKLLKKTGPLARVLRVVLDRIDLLLKPWKKDGPQLSDISAVEMAAVENQQRLMAGLQQEMGRILARIDRLEGRLDTAGAVASDVALVRQELRYQQRNLNLMLDELRQPENLQHAKAVATAHADDQMDAYYVAFEDACRGTREQIRAAMEVYLPYLQALTERGETRLLDLGCGRGEWLQLMREQGWQVQGIDMNRVMVQQCQEAELEVSQADALAHLQSLPEASVDLISGFHIIEHLPFATLFGVFNEAMRVLTPGGRILFETPNPENLLVGSHTFYHDPTHRNPVTPTSVEFLARYHGFVDAEIIRLHPYPEEAKVAGIDPLTERVNGHLCGPQDYAIMAVKPEVQA
ncbi:class I SAM-dependent methyltransferase [Marinobacterium arenosum]|uniref:class I SAM-dependent methyltransferase n=1 Tax=Marinobacterium arenosum TaxID=2862496 RepID=UPI001C951C86|nr:class I SAM-dependent methyltransferase [Marinobacterium arenosum]MBY4676800.1 methyltransferase domain-containing protein [Marinobacterium arenosum]